MNDEFIITKSITTGSEGSSQTCYLLSLMNKGIGIEELSKDEIIRLNIFLTAYLNQEGGTNEK